MYLTSSLCIVNSDGCVNFITVPECNDTYSLICLMKHVQNSTLRCFARIQPYHLSSTVPLLLREVILVSHGIYLVPTLYIYI